LYRIVQEALTNVAKHARASHVSLILEYRPSSLLAIIEDDGRGFDPDGLDQSDGRGLGIFGMEERAELMGGALTIESRIGEGTTVYVELPLEARP
ncbi:MAG: sensor histidine kinase, partial [Armatimonadota bacterium]